MEYFFYPTTMIEEYYKMCDDLDKERYPGYQMAQLEEEAQTNTTTKRKDLLETIVVFQGFYFELYKERGHISYLIRRALEDDDQNAAEKNQERLEEVEEQMKEFRINIFGTIDEVYAEEKKRKERIATFLAN